jgi:hypothetical protein
VRESVGSTGVPMGSSGTSPPASFAIDLLLPCLYFSDQRAPAVSIVGQELAVGRAAHAAGPVARVSISFCFSFLLFIDLNAKFKNAYLEIGRSKRSDSNFFVLCVVSSFY